MKLQAKLYWLVHEFFCIYHKCEQRRHRRACTFAQYHHSLCCSHWKKEKGCRWIFRRNFVPSMAMVLLLLIHSLIFLPLDCWGSVFGACLVMHYLVFCLVLQSSWRGRESMMSYFNCLPTINVLWLLLTVPWVGLKCVIVVLVILTYFL